MTAVMRVARLRQQRVDLRAVIQCVLHRSEIASRCSSNACKYVSRACSIELAQSVSLPA